ARERVDIAGAVVGAPAAALHRLDLGETRLPEPQHMLGNVEIVSDLADGTERIRRLVQMLGPLSSPECWFWLSALARFSSRESKIPLRLKRLLYLARLLHAKMLP